MLLAIDCFLLSCGVNSAKPKRKRKECSKEEKTCEVEIDKDHSVLREDKEREVEVSTKM